MPQPSKTPGDREGGQGAWLAGLPVILLLAYEPAYSQHVLVSFNARATGFYLAEQVRVEEKSSLLK